VAHRLAIFPVGLALFDQGTEAFLGIFEAIKLVEKNVHGLLEAVFDGEAHAAEDGFFGHAEDRGGMRGDARDEIFDGFFELGFGDQAIDHTEFEGALGGYRLASQDDLERDFRTDQVGQDRGGQRREYADGDFGLGEARFRRGHDQVAERGQLGATADGRAIYDADDRLADFEHAGEDGVEGFEHLEDALRSVFSDVDAAGENFAGGIEDHELDFFGGAGEENAVGDFAEHGLVEKIVVGAVESHAGDVFVDAELYGFELAGVTARGLRGEIGGGYGLNHVGPPEIGLVTTCCGTICGQNRC
jgi:hypothetical protein